MGHDKQVDEFVKYEKVKAATNTNISEAEAFALVYDNDDDILYSLALNKSVPPRVLISALFVTVNPVVKNRIKKTLKSLE